MEAYLKSVAAQNIELKISAIANDRSVDATEALVHLLRRIGLHRACFSPGERRVLRQGRPC